MTGNGSLAPLANSGERHVLWLGLTCPPKCAPVWKATGFGGHCAHQWLHPSRYLNMLLGGLAGGRSRGGAWKGSFLPSPPLKLCFALLLGCSGLRACSFTTPFAVSPPGCFFLAAKVNLFSLKFGCWVFCPSDGKVRQPAWEGSRKG